MSYCHGRQCKKAILAAAGGKTIFIVTIVLDCVMLLSVHNPGGGGGGELPEIWVGVRRSFGNPYPFSDLPRRRTEVVRVQASNMDSSDKRTEFIENTVCTLLACTRTTSVLRRGQV